MRELHFKWLWGLAVVICIAFALVRWLNVDDLLSKSSEPNAREYYNRGIGLAKNGKDRQAISQLDRAIALDPKLAEAYCARGFSLGRTGQAEKALADLSRAVELKPDFAKAWLTRGDVYLSLGETKVALENYTRAIESDVSLASAYRQRGICRAKLGQPHAAIEDYTTNLQLAPVNSNMLLRRAELYFKLGKYKQAVEDCQKAVEHAPENWKVHCQLAMIYGTAADAKIRDGEKAVREGAQANELGQGAWETLFALAAAHAENGDFEQAGMWQEQAIEAAPASQKAAMKQVLQLFDARQPYRHRPIQDLRQGDINDLEADAAAVLRSLPGVAKVEKLTNPAEIRRRIIHIRDWHFVSREEFAAEARQLADEKIDVQYEAFLQQVAAVQQDQIAMLRYLIDHHGVTSVFQEGLTDKDLPGYRAQIEVLTETKREIDGSESELALLEQNDDLRGKMLAVLKTVKTRHRLDLLRVGAPGQLLLSGELKEVLPLEDASLYDAANPASPAGFNLDSDANAAREKAMVERMRARGKVAIAILGGGHDLSDDVGEDCELLVVTPKSYRGRAD